MARHPHGRWLRAALNELAKLIRRSDVGQNRLVNFANPLRLYLDGVESLVTEIIVDKADGGCQVPIGTGRLPRRQRRPRCRSGTLFGACGKLYQDRCRMAYPFATRTIGRKKLQVAERGQPAASAQAKVRHAIVPASYYGEEKGSHLHNAGASGG